jgi:hypothetical protein
VGGIAGADSKCQTEAGQAGKTGTFKAWISVGTDNPVSRFTAYTNVIFKLGNGLTFANSWNDVISGNLQNPIYWHADGSAVTILTSDTAWTNTTPAGLTFYTVDNKTCKGFTSAGITDGTRWWAEFGSIQYYGTNWTNWTSGHCDNAAGGFEEQYRGRLYCFEQ